MDDHFQGADPGMVWLELFGIALAGGITALALLGIEVKLIKMTSTLTLEVISKVRLYALRGILLKYARVRILYSYTKI